MITGLLLFLFLAILAIAGGGVLFYSLAGESPKTLYWLIPHAGLVILAAFAIKDTFSWPAGMLFPLLVVGFAAYVFVLVAWATNRVLQVKKR